MHRAAYGKGRACRTVQSLPGTGRGTARPLGRVVEGVLGVRARRVPVLTDAAPSTTRVKNASGPPHRAGEE
jgi:hypothetical protein